MMINVVQELEQKGKESCNYVDGTQDTNSYNLIRFIHLLPVLLVSMVKAVKSLQVDITSLSSEYLS